MRAFEVKLVASQRLFFITTLCHGLSLVMLLVYFDGILEVMGVCLLLAAFAYAHWVQRLRRRGAIKRIAVNRQGQAVVEMGLESEQVGAQLLSGSLIMREVMLLRWLIGKRIYRQILLPDMTGVEEYRRLLVWARWGLPKQVSAEDES